VGANGRPQALTAQKIDRMSLGQLANAFGHIQKPNQADSLIAQVLASINPDRVRSTHFHSSPTTERNLRANVGRHMWRILNALKVACR
jgi:hypothetical protein